MTVALVTLMSACGSSDGAGSDPVPASTGPGAAVFAEEYSGCDYSEDFSEYVKTFDIRLPRDATGVKYCEDPGFGGTSGYLQFVTNTLGLNSFVESLNGDPSQFRFVPYDWRDTPQEDLWPSLKAGNEYEHMGIGANNPDCVLEQDLYLLRGPGDQIETFVKSMCLS